MSQDPTNHDEQIRQLKEQLDEERWKNASLFELFLDPKTRGRMIRVALWTFLGIVLIIVGLVVYSILAGIIVFE